MKDKDPFAQVHGEGHSGTGINKVKGTRAEENDVEIGTDQPYGFAGRVLTSQLKGSAYLLATLLCKGPDNKYFQLCGPYVPAKK